MMLRLLEHLRREHAQVLALVAALDAEYTAMQAGHFAALPALIERKAECLAQIAELDRLRAQEQSALGYSADLRGAQALAASGGEALVQAWGLLQHSAREASRCNHRNGVLVHTQLDFARQALGFLKPGSQTLYGPDGTHARQGRAGHALGRG